MFDEILGSDQDVPRAGAGEKRIGELRRQMKSDLHLFDDEA
ncbi:hypothetical protein [Bradyrhizobium sp. USDA 4451]